METSTYSGPQILERLTRLLAEVSSEQFRAPDYPKPPRARFVGMATENQKALVTLRETILAKHEALHLENNMRFGGHVGLPLEHQMLHAGHLVLETLLTVDLSNTFKELSDDVPYYIDRNWKVYVVKRPMGPRPPKVGPKKEGIS